MDVINAIKSRRSVRSFKKKKVSLNTVKKILELASLSPSGSNTQPWNVHVLIGDSLNKFTEEMVKEFKKNNQSLKLERLNYMKKYRSPYQERRRKVGWDLYELLNIKKGDYKKTLNFHTLNYSFFNAPLGLIFSIEKDLGWMSWLDYGMFLQNICLLCRSFGLHSCPQAAWGLVYKKANKFLNLENNFTVHCGMAIGYENKNNNINTLKTEREKLDNFCKILN
ncbi:MAG: nitroreductase [Pelagibacterales bacterium]|nr:nitroreductase [Pelagibacterales bacterium]